MGFTSPPMGGCVLFDLRLRAFGAEGDEEAGLFLFGEEDHIPCWKHLFRSGKNVKRLGKSSQKGKSDGIKSTQSQFPGHFHASPSPGAVGAATPCPLASQGGDLVTE